MCVYLVFSVVLARALMVGSPPYDNYDKSDAGSPLRLRRSSYR
jgi:hypothetical protein